MRKELTGNSIFLIREDLDKYSRDYIKGKEATIYGRGTMVVSCSPADIDFGSEFLNVRAVRKTETGMVVNEGTHCGAPKGNLEPTNTFMLYNYNVMPANEFKKLFRKKTP